MPLAVWLWTLDMRSKKPSRPVVASFVFRASQTRLGINCIIAQLQARKSSQADRENRRKKERKK